MKTVLSFSPVAQAELAKEQVHASSKTKVHKLAACLGCIRVVFECWKMLENGWKQNHDFAVTVRMMQPTSTSLC